MSHETDSPERIAADILIAAIESAPGVSQKEALCDPQQIPQHYQSIFESVFSARDKAVKDT